MALMHVQFFSNELQMETALDAIIPRSCARPCPVLYLLHGCSDDHTIWQRRTAIERYADPLGLAVIMPGVARSFFTDMASGPRYYSFVSEELPGLVRGWFPVSRLRRDTYVAGLSMGGYGAFKLAMRHPENYAAAASLSGALDWSSGAGIKTRSSTGGALDFRQYAQVRGSQRLFRPCKQACERPTRERRAVQCGTEDACSR